MSDDDFVRVPVPPHRKWKIKGQEMRVFLMDRDGMECWFCGKDLGTQSSIEHLIPKSVGGPDNAHNLVLAHITCNNIAGDKPLVGKIKLRLAMRGQL